MFVPSIPDQPNCLSSSTPTIHLVSIINIYIPDPPNYLQLYTNNTFNINHKQLYPRPPKLPLVLHQQYI